MSAIINKPLYRRHFILQKKPLLWGIHSNTWFLAFSPWSHNNLFLFSPNAHYHDFSLDFFIIKNNNISSGIWFQTPYFHNIMSFFQLSWSNIFSPKYMYIYFTVLWHLLNKCYHFLIYPSAPSLSSLFSLSSLGSTICRYNQYLGKALNSKILCYRPCFPLVKIPFSLCWHPSSRTLLQKNDTNRLTIFIFICHLLKSSNQFF